MTLNLGKLCSLTVELRSRAIQIQTLIISPVDVYRQVCSMQYNTLLPLVVIYTIFKTWHIKAISVFNNRKYQEHKLPELSTSSSSIC